jgi:hypothetical protein
MTDTNEAAPPFAARALPEDPRGGRGSAAATERRFPPLLLRALLSAVTFVLACVVQPSSAQSPGGGSIVNATFTSAIADGAPVDFRQSFLTNTRVVYFYAELLDLQGQTVKHRWRLEGKPMQEVPIAVTRAREPSWSSLAMQPEWTGDWTVEVIDGRGQVIGRGNFAYNPL